MNIFDKATKESTPNSKKKTDKVIVKVTNSQFDKDLKRFAQLKAELDVVQSKLDMVEADFKPACVGVFNEQYKETGVYPESFIASSKSGASIMVVPTDRYIKPTEETFAELNEKYGGEITESVVEFTLDKNMVQKYGEEISKAITGSKLPDDVKKNLIKAKTTITVKKGSIQRAMTVGKGKVPEFIEDIRPVFQLKNPKLNEEG